MRFAETRHESRLGEPPSWIKPAKSPALGRVRARRPRRAGARPRRRGPRPSPCRGGPGASSRWSSRCTPSTRPIVWLLASVLPQIGSELGLDETQAGWLVTVLLIGAAAAGPAVGYLADRLGRPRLLAIGVRRLEPGRGRHRPGPVVRPDPGRAGGGGGRRGGHHRHRADPPGRRVPPPDARPRVRRLLPGGAGRGGAGAGSWPRRCRPSPAGRRRSSPPGAPGWRWPCSPCSSPSPSGAPASRSTSPGSGCTSRSGPATKITSTSWSTRRSITRSSAWRSRRSRWPGWPTGARLPRGPRGWRPTGRDGSRPLILLAAAVTGTVAGGWLADAFAVTQAPAAVPPPRPGDARRDRLRPGGHLRPARPP